MSVLLMPVGNDAPFVDSSGNPLSGGQLFFYTAGSSTPQDTYTTSSGGVANANPVVLGSTGYPTVSGSVVEIWGTAGVSYKAVLKNAAGTTLWTRDNLSLINDSSVSIDQWIAGPAPTYISATSFTLVGDQTSTFHVGRRVKTTNSGGTVYGTITVSAYAVVTTVTVVNDSGALDAGLSAVYYGLLSATNPSTPLLTDAYPIVSGSADKTKKVRFEVDGLTTATTRVITLPDADISIIQGTFTASLTGCTTVPTVTATYSVTNNVATVFYPTLTGTSNTTACTITGQPAAIRPTTAHSGFFASVQDNSGIGGVGFVSIGTDGVVTLYATAAAAAFTAAGTKGIPNGFTVTYNLS